MYSKKAFTLAEVLITLVIIGIIAAVTVPTLMANYRKQEVSSRLKKFYSTLSNAVRLAEIDRGSPLRDEYANNGWFTGSSNTTFWEDNLGKYMPAVKTDIDYERTCNHNSGDGTCETYNPVYMLNDGSMIIYYEGTPNGQFTMDVDINGMKKPNMYGKDIFRFKVQGPSKNCNYQTKVFGGYECGFKPSRSSLINQCSGYSLPDDCTRLLMMDGWEVKDDYPLL
ncbi:MAG: type II secretion system GspH family protein [Candidatus Gastranaerophilales bacterium]|nr:type II secretion system GspH family protein [Candidatus Gastranaerophilales bacterium]